MTPERDPMPASVADARAWLRERGFLPLMTDFTGNTWINGASVMTVDGVCAKLDAEREDA